VHLFAASGIDYLSICNPINPENPDSKPLAAASIISNGDWGVFFFWNIS
jgi:hypothetical protein